MKLRTTLHTKKNVILTNRWDGLTIPLGAIGAIEDIRVKGPHEMEFTLNTETECGLELIGHLRAGRATLAGAYDEQRGGPRTVPFKLEINWSDWNAQEAWLFKLNQNSLLGDIGSRHDGTSPLKDPPKPA